MAGQRNMKNTPKKRRVVRNGRTLPDQLVAGLDANSHPKSSKRNVGHNRQGSTEMDKIQRSLEAEHHLKERLGRLKDQRSTSQRRTRGRGIIDTDETPEYNERVDYFFVNGAISEETRHYYLEEVRREDFSQAPGQGGRPSLLKSIIRQEAENLRGTGWRPKRAIGKGGYGTVVLWEKIGKDGLPIRVATKDAQPHNFYRDYCSEAHLTRRLNDLGCKNVINVVEWAYIEGTTWEEPNGSIGIAEPKWRICYEYAEHGDLWDLEKWYRDRQLILPEPFLWHVFYSVANALCYCRRGTNGPTPLPRWDTIFHADIKQGNLFLTTPDPEENALYPAVKLADFGLAYTLGHIPEIQHFKSAFRYGTEGYMAPEMQDNTPEEEGRRRALHQLVGSHSDIYSLGSCFHDAFELLLEHTPVATTFLDIMQSDRFHKSTIKQANTLYSQELKSLLNSCLQEDPRYRPKTYNLYCDTRACMEKWRARAYADEARAAREGRPRGCFHSSVLFTKQDRYRYDNDPVFRREYRYANLQPLLNILGPQQAPQRELRSQTARGRQGTARRGQQRGGVEKKRSREGRGKEAKKRTLFGNVLSRIGF